ncbi:hypothetical protein [Streptomyces sp. NPDC004528]|uniref:hypothetical protein n=1 Tax=Streptomyces sp. NPDC004528 TaxID=3154550 RepID=UPI0033AE2B46
MKYTDNGGDTWEETTPGLVRVVVLGGVAVTDSQPSAIDYVTEKWGPLTPLDDSDYEPAEPSLPTVSDVMSRADVFQAANSLVKGMGLTEAASVYDVLSVAKWLEGSE